MSSKGQEQLTKMENARAKRAKVLKSIVTYAKFSKMSNKFQPSTKQSNNNSKTLKNWPQLFKSWIVLFTG